MHLYKYFKAPGIFASKVLDAHLATKLPALMAFRASYSILVGCPETLPQTFLTFLYTLYKIMAITRFTPHAWQQSFIALTYKK
jgi:hypothetical protein